MAPPIEPTAYELLKLMLALTLIPFILTIGAASLIGVGVSAIGLLVLSIVSGLPRVILGSFWGGIAGAIIFFMGFPKISDSDSYVDTMLVVIISNIALFIMLARVTQLSAFGAP